ncbi:MAG: hypothetical protein ACFFDN_35235 [Candidatus Hodarchaeota archaeon]
MSIRRGFKAIIKVCAISFVFALIISLYMGSREPYGTMDFYGTSREVSLEELIEFAKEKDISLHLPSELPRTLKLTAIYLKEGPFIAILVYSAEGNKDYKTAELTIEICYSGSQPTIDELESQIWNTLHECVMEINDWPVEINERAYSGGITEFRNKYGDYTLLVDVYIDGYRYGINAPTLTKDDAIQLVGSMRVVHNF